MSKKSKENKTELVPALEPRVPNRAYTEMKNDNQMNSQINHNNYQNKSQAKNKTESKNCNK